MSRNEQIWIAVILLIAIVVFIFKDDLFEERAYDVDIDDSFSFDPADLNVYGCTDPIAENYMPDANMMGDREFACFYNYGCCDVNATNYDPNADSCWQDGNNEFLCNYSGDVGDYGTYDSTNFNSIAMHNSGTCTSIGDGPFTSPPLNPFTGQPITPPIDLSETIINAFWQHGGATGTMPTTVCATQPNDCTCSNMTNDTYMDCMGDNANGITRTNQYCTGGSDGSKYCNSAHYNCAGPLPPYA